MDHPVLFVALAAPPVVLVLAVLVLRNRIQDRLFAGTGLAEWRGVRRDLPRDDRREIARAVKAGRLAPSHLTCLAARQATVSAAVLESTATRSSAFWKWRVVAVAIMGLNGVLGVVMVAGDPASLNGWSRVASALAVLWLVLVGPRINRNQLATFRRAEEVNAAACEKDPEPQLR